MKYTIAIDGPAASGKSSAAELVARRLGFERLDSGLLYRAITHTLYQHLPEDVDLESADVIRKVEALNISQRNGRIFCDGKDITEYLRTPLVDSRVGKVAKILYIRNKAHKIQKEVIEANGDGIVVDGRDIGTVVIPDAFLKIFITAKDTVRAMRRSKQTGQNYEEVLNDLKQRDHADITRQHGPLKMAEDAILVENDEISLPETVERIVDYFEKRRSQ